MAYASLADFNGEIAVTFFPKPWSELKEKITDNTVTALKGKIKKDSVKKDYVFFADASPNLARLKSKAAKKMPEKPAPELHIRLQRTAVGNRDALFIVKKTLEENPGSSPVFFHVPVQQGETTIRTITMVNSGAAVQELHRCTGIAEIWEI